MGRSSSSGNNFKSVDSSVLVLSLVYVVVAAVVAALVAWIVVVVVVLIRYGIRIKKDSSTVINYCNLTINQLSNYR